MTKACNLLDTRIDIVDMDYVLAKMQEWIVNKDYGNYICISNMNDIIHARRHEDVKRATNTADLSVPDGMSLVYLARLEGFNIKRRIYGPDLMHDFLTLSQNKGYTHFFYGGTRHTLDALVDKYRQSYPRLNITGSYSPPFGELDEEEKQDIANTINSLSPDVLWVGLGCPKQQLWMHEHRNRLKVPVMVGVGAAFDFLSGLKPQAPKWMQDTGLEWLFRFLNEPARLWKRYFYVNMFFLYLAAPRFVKRCIRIKKGV